jgi:hypothetical protein
MKALVVTSWAGNASAETPMRPKVINDFPNIGLEDKTDQPTQNIIPDPNVLVVLIEALESIVDQIEASEHVVIWSE